MFEMDRLERPLVNLPLLKDPSTYIPDTVDLTDDAMARKYWLTCFEEALDGVNIRGVVPANGSGKSSCGPTCLTNKIYLYVKPIANKYLFPCLLVENTNQKLHKFVLSWGLRKTPG